MSFNYSEMALLEVEKRDRIQFLVIWSSLLMSRKVHNTDHVLFKSLIELTGLDILALTVRIIIIGVNIIIVRVVLSC